MSELVSVNHSYTLIKDEHWHGQSIPVKRRPKSKPKYIIKPLVKYLFMRITGNRELKLSLIMQKLALLFLLLLDQPILQMRPPRSRPIKSVSHWISATKITLIQKFASSLT